MDIKLDSNLKMISPSAMMYASKKYNIDPAFGNSNIRCAVYLMRRQWTEFHCIMMSSPPTKEFLAGLAFKFLDEGDEDIFEKIIDMLSDKDVISAAEKVHTKTMVSLKLV